MQQNITNIKTNINRSVGTIRLKDSANEIVTACGSLGSKFEMLYERKMYSEIAQDIVSSALNKLACTGATLVGFSEYIKTDSKEISEIIEREISSELKKYNCEEMSVKIENAGANGVNGINNSVCGFALGINPIEKEEIISGDIVIGLASNGLHFNGYEYIKDFDPKDIVEALKPAYNYYNDIMTLYRNSKIKLGVNITKGGIYHCLNKVLPKGLTADLNLKHILKQPVFETLKETTGNEFYSLFNAGIGYCLITDRASNEIFFEECQKYDPIVLGVIQ